MIINIDKRKLAKYLVVDTKYKINIRPNNRTHLAAYIEYVEDIANIRYLFWHYSYEEITKDKLSVEEIEKEVQIYGQPKTPL